MAWQASWLGSWLSNWLGPIGADTDVTVNVTTSIVSVLNTTAVAFSAIEATATTDTLSVLSQPTTVVGTAVVQTGFDYVSLFNADATVDLPTIVDVTTSTVLVYYDLSVTISSGAIANAVPSNVVTNSVAVSVIGIANVTTTHDVLIVNDPPAYGLGYSYSLVAQDTLTISNTNVGVVGHSYVASVYDQVSVFITQVNVTGSAFSQLVAVDVLLDSTDVAVYDYNDIYQRIEASVAKVYSPEILAFSTDITTDMMVVDAIGTDMESVDGTQQIKLLRKTDNVVIDMRTGQAVPENKIYTFENALIRQISDRDNRAVKQLRLFMQSVQNDDFYTMDTIIELPIREDVQILTGDVIQADMIGTRYTVIAIDTCTLKTRWRVGARRIS